MVRKVAKPWGGTKGGDADRNQGVADVARVAGLVAAAVAIGTIGGCAGIGMGEIFGY